MSRRKQSNPKPIKHDDDGDEMDGGDGKTTGNVYPLSSKAGPKEGSTIVWGGPQSDSDEPCGTQANSVVASIDSLKLSDKRTQLTDSESLITGATESGQTRKGGFIGSSEDQINRNSKTTMLCPPSPLNRTDQLSASLAIKISIAAEDERETFAANNCNVFPAFSRSKSPCYRENDKTADPPNSDPRSKRLSICSPHNLHDKETLPFSESISKSPVRSLSPRENLNNENGHSNDLLVEHHSDHKDHILSECQVPNISNDQKKQPMGKDCIHKTPDTALEGNSSKSSSMARFPIIPSGKSSANFSRSLSQSKQSHPIDHCNTSMSTNFSSFSIANLTNSTTPRTSPENSPSSARSSSPRPTSPALSPRANRADSNLLRSQEEAELALVNQLQLPSDVLYLRQQEVNIHGTPNLGWVVCCAIPLPQGSSLGPFQGQLVAPEDVKVGDLIVQFTNKKGQQALMNVAEQSGGWLALLRTPQSPAQRNTHVYWEGGRIWCEIVSDIDMGAELRASFSFQHEEEEDDEEEERQGDQPATVRDRKRTTPSSSPPLPPPSPSQGDSVRCVKEEEMKVEDAAVESRRSSSSSSTGGGGSGGDSTVSSMQRPHLQQLPPHPNQQQPAPGHAALIYGCPFCGVRFSSPRTLQGHLSFYCSKKTSDSRHFTTSGGAKHKGNNQVKPDDCDIKQQAGERSPGHERAGIKRRANDAEIGSNSDMRLSPSSPPLTKIGRGFTSPHFSTGCPGYAEKQSTVNSHKSVHTNEPDPGTSARTKDQPEKGSTRFNPPVLDSVRHPATVLKAPSSETFCKECKIQFSSLRTYKCHKEHYCAQRRKKSLVDPSPFAAMFNSPFPFSADSASASAGIPSALQMSALSQGGLILPGQGGQVTAAAAAAAMILQANMAAMSLPGVLLNQGESGPSSSTRLRSLVHSSFPLSHTGRDDSPEVQRHGLSRVRRTSETDEKSIASTSTSIPFRGQIPKTRSPEDNFSIESERLNQKEKDKTLDSERYQDKEVIESPTRASEGRSVSRDDEHPLDLSVTKLESNQHQQRYSPSTSLRVSPNRETDFKERSSLGNSLSSKSESEIQNEVTPELNPRSNETKCSAGRHSPREINPALAVLGPGILSPGSAKAHLLAHHGHPSLLLPPPGFLSAPPTTPPSHPALNISPLGRRRRQESPSAVAKNISKCLDCNIVFYKHDNYLIHKKHYCSGKRRPAPTNSRSVSPDSPLVHPSQNAPSSPQRIGVSSQSRSPQKHIENSPASSSGSAKVSSPLQPPENSSSPPRQQPGKMKYKFFCVPCRIKFSNASILEAHKEYYCPAGKDSEHSVILQSSNTSSEESGSHLATIRSSNENGDEHQRRSCSPEQQHEEVTCNRCNSVFTSARLLRLHVCDGGFPCPHCDHVAITENRLAEHLKVHAPTRAYRCTICGYRGNTARGMRMHGKTHIDEGLDFTDENMLEYEEPAVMPILSHAATAALAGGAATDSELLRLKNEPYKRRRSRKAYEKFDYPLPKVDIPQTCPLCGQNFANADFLASHFKVHQIAASQYLAGLMKCIHCSYVGKSPEDLRAHFEASHASNHRIHVPQRISPGQGAEECQREFMFMGNDLDTRSPQDERMDLGESPNSSGPHTHMVITDPNSPLNERSFMKTDKDYADDETDPPHSSSAFKVKIKEEPMEQDEQVDSHNKGSVDHFLHMPVATDLEPREEHESPPLRKLSVSPSVFLHRKESSEGSNQERVRYSGTPSVDNCHKDYSPEIFIKKEPSTEETDTVLSLRNEVSTSDEKPQSNDSAADYSDSPRTRTSPGASAGHTPTDNKGDDGGNVDTKISQSKDKENESDLSKSPIAVHASPPSSVSQPIHVQVKQEIEETDPARPNFLSSPGSRGEIKEKSQDISPCSPSRPDEGPDRPQDNEPILYTRDHAASPLTSSRPQVSPRQTSCMTASIAPSVSLSAAFPPQTLFHHHALPFPYPNPQTLPFFFLPGQTHIGGPHQGFSMGSREDRGSRYCQNCDISFSKQATYLAHKKYYCTARPRGEPQPSATA